MRHAARGVTRNPESPALYSAAPRPPRLPSRRPRPPVNDGARDERRRLRRRTRTRGRGHRRGATSPTTTSRSTTSTTMTTSRCVDLLEIDIDAARARDPGRRRSSRPTRGGQGGGRGGRRPRPRRGAPPRRRRGAARRAPPGAHGQRHARGRRGRDRGGRARRRRPGRGHRPGSSRDGRTSSSARRASSSCPGTSSRTRSGCSAATARRRRRHRSSPVDPGPRPAAVHVGTASGSDRGLPRAGLLLAVVPAVRLRTARAASRSSRCCGRGAARHRDGPRSTASSAGSRSSACCSSGRAYFGAVAIVPFVVAEAAYWAARRRARRCARAARRALAVARRAQCGWSSKRCAARWPLGGLLLGRGRRRAARLRRSPEHWRAWAVSRWSRSSIICFDGLLLDGFFALRPADPAASSRYAGASARAAHGRAHAGRIVVVVALADWLRFEPTVTGHDPVRAAAGQRPEPQPDPAGDRQQLPDQQAPRARRTRCTGTTTSSCSRSPRSRPTRARTPSSRPSSSTSPRSTTRSCSPTPRRAAPDGGLYNANVAYDPDGQLPGHVREAAPRAVRRVRALARRAQLHQRAAADPVRLRAGPHAPDVPRRRAPLRDRDLLRVGVLPARARLRARRRAG